MHTSHFHSSSRASLGFSSRSAPLSGVSPSTAPLTAPLLRPRDLINGVNHMHANFMFHRDLKIENIVVDGDDFALKIMDFGFAKEVGGGYGGLGWRLVAVN